MTYLDLVGNLGDPIDTSIGWQPQIDSENQTIYVRSSTQTRAVVGESRPVVTSLLGLDESGIMNLLLNDAVVSGKAFFEFLDSAMGIRMINCNATHVKRALYSNAGGVGVLQNIPFVGRGRGRRLKFNQVHELVRTRALNDISYNDDGEVDVDSRSILDGPPSSIETVSILTEEVQNTMWDDINAIESGLMEIETLSIPSRSANVKDELTNMIYCKNSISTDISFITHFQLPMEGTSTTIEVALLDSASIVHPNKGSEVLIQHDYDAAYAQNGKLSITAFDNYIQINNFSNIGNKPIQQPVLICEVFDMYDTSEGIMLDANGRGIYVIVDGEYKLLTICD